MDGATCHALAPGAERCGIANKGPRTRWLLDTEMQTPV